MGLAVKPWEEYWVGVHYIHGCISQAHDISLSGIYQAFLRNTLSISYGLNKHISGISHVYLKHISEIAHAYIKDISAITQAYVKHI